MRACCDVAVIGGGVLGCFAARELAGLGLHTVLVEQEAELCAGITKANTAIVYSGAYAKPGTLKAELCVRASQGFGELCTELDVRFERPGSLMACFGPRGRRTLERFLDYGRQNGVEGLRIISGDEARAMEPGLSSEVSGALFDPNVGTVLPWELGLAAARDAAARGVHICRGTQVCDITYTGGNYALSLVPTPHIPGSVRAALGSPSAPTELHARVVVNCAGLCAAEVLAMLVEPRVHIVPEKGSYYVLDTKAASSLQHIVFCEPEIRQKGLTLVPTVGGNILLGPTQEDAVGADDHATTLQGFDWLNAQTQKTIGSTPLKHLVRSFAAIRPNPYWAKRDANTGELVIAEKSIDDFVIERHDEHTGFISLIGIKTPGLTCAHELGKLVASELAAYLGKTQGGYRAHSSIGVAQVAEQDEDDGRIVCRCRSITRGEIVAALRCEPRPVTLDGVKRLTECGMGRCQGSFCTQRVLEIMAEELDVPVTDLLKDVPDSQIVLQQGRAASEIAQLEGGHTQAIRSVSAPDAPQQVAEPAPASMFDASAAPTVAMSAPAFTGLDLAANAAISTLGPVACNVAIVGGGAAGMTAALELVRQGVRDIALIDREPQLGGILNQCIHDGFGMEVFGENITGVEFAARLRAQVLQAGDAITCYCDTTVLSIEELPSQGGKQVIERELARGDRGPAKPPSLCHLPCQPQARLVLSGAGGTRELFADKVVLASGCRERPAASLPLAGTRPTGIVAAGALQKMLNCAGWQLGTRAVVLGSGDIGLIMARRLKLAGCEVPCVVEIGDHCGGRPFNKQRCLDAYGIPLALNSTVTEVFGKERVSGVTVRDCKTAAEQRIDCDLLVSSIGLIPERELVEHLRDDIPPWLIACGNADHVYDLVDTLVKDTQTKLQGPFIS